MRAGIGTSAAYSARESLSDFLQLIELDKLWSGVQVAVRRRSAVQCSLLDSIAASTRYVAAKRWA